MQKMIVKFLQRYWRISRGLTMGAQGCVIDSAGRVLLVRHTYRPGWHFPGGGVEKRESALEALTRELWEEAGVKLDDEPQLFGLYANHVKFPGDHIALYVVRTWHHPVPPTPNREIAEQAFFSPDNLPETVYAPTRARCAEIFSGAAKSSYW